MDFNEYLLKIRSEKLSIEVPLKRGKRYGITSEIEIRKCAETETDEELPNMEYDARFTGIVNILGETGEIIRTKDKNKASQRLRGRIYIYQKDNGSDENEDDFYQNTMNKLIICWDEVMDLLKTKE